LAFTQEQRDELEAVVCYDFDNGEQRWVHTDAMQFTESMGGNGPRATPTVHDSRVYARGATGMLNCLEARTGQVVWSRNILEGRKNLQWGMAGSPLIVDSKVLVNCGPAIGVDADEEPGPEQGALAAFD